MSERLTIHIGQDLRDHLSEASIKARINVSEIVRRCIEHSLDEIVEQLKPSKVKEAVVS